MDLPVYITSTSRWVLLILSVTTHGTSLTGHTGHELSLLWPRASTGLPFITSLAPLSGRLLVIDQNLPRPRHKQSFGRLGRECLAYGSGCIGCYHHC